MVARFFIDRCGWHLKIRDLATSRQPAPTRSYPCISIGDVGFIRRGQFHLLFSAGSTLGDRQLGVDVPSTFEQLNVGPPVSGQPRRPACLHTPTVRQIGATLDPTESTTPCVPSLIPFFAVFMSVPSRLPEHATIFSFELTGDRGAALVTRHETRSEDTLLEAGFERYIKLHYKSWFSSLVTGGTGTISILFSCPVSI